MELRGFRLLLIAGFLTCSFCLHLNGRRLALNKIN